MRIVSTTDYHGHLWKYPPPPNIGPGQVGVFMHVKTRAAMSGSKGYVTYKAKNPHGVDSNVHLGFDAGYMNQQRRVHAVIGDDDKSLKDFRRDLAEGKGFNKVERDGIEVLATIGQNYCPVCHFFIGYSPELLSEEMKKLKLGKTSEEDDEESKNCVYK